MRWSLVAVVLALGCGSAKSAADGGAGDGGDAGFVPDVTDGGALGAPCSNLGQCAGNALCGGSETCSRTVICAAGVCASAGGALQPETVDLAFGGSVADFIDYVQVNVYAPQLVGGGTLDCATLLQDLDGGANEADVTRFNPFFPSVAQPVHPDLTQDPTGGVWKFPLPEVASGMGRVLLLDAYETENYSDGGDKYLGTACATFDNDLSDGGAGSVGITISGN